MKFLFNYERFTVYSTCLLVYLYLLFLRVKHMLDCHESRGILKSNSSFPVSSLTLHISWYTVYTNAFMHTDKLEDVGPYSWQGSNFLS